MTERNEGSGVSTGRKLNRRDFLKMGGAGLAGAALLGATGCGGGSGGSGDLIFSMGPDDEQGTMAALIKKFNEQSDFKVVHRVMPSDTGTYFDKLRTQLQAGSGGIDVIGGDVIWPAQLAANGWIVDMSDKFPESEQKKFLEGPLQSVTYDGKVWGSVVHGRRDALPPRGPSGEERLLGTPQDVGRAQGDGHKVKQDQGTKTASSSKPTRVGCATVWSTSGPTAAMRSTRTTRTRSSSTAPRRPQASATEASMLSSGVAPEGVSLHETRRTRPLAPGTRSSPGTGRTCTRIWHEGLPEAGPGWCRAAAGG